MNSVGSFDEAFFGQQGFEQEAAEVRHMDGMDWHVISLTVAVWCMGLGVRWHLLHLLLMYHHC